MYAVRDVLRAHWLLSILLILTLGWVIWAAYLILPQYQSDWIQAYRPAVLRLLAGHSPYDPFATRPFLNAPWTLLPLIPLALLPPEWGQALLCGINLVCYSIVAVKLGARPLALAAFLVSYPVVFGIIYGQIDGLISLGYILPPTLGLFLVLAKPQSGLGLAIFWLIDAWYLGRWRKVLSTFLPVTVAFGLSYFLFGNWFSTMSYPASQSWNTSLWPQSIPIGSVLLVSALQQRKPGLAIASSPFLSPYVAAHSWAATLIGLMPNSLLTIIASIGTWLVWLFRKT